MTVADSCTVPSLITVVIPALNAAELISQQLEALSRQTYGGPWDVVVVDNGSTDTTRDVVQSWAGRVPGLRVVDASAHKGHSIARNAGAAAAAGDFLLFCDADDVASPQWVHAMAEAAATADLLGGHIDKQALNLESVREWRRDRRPDVLPSKMGFLPFAISANVGIRTSVLHEIGRWNERYLEGCNDVEMCWRAQLAGYVLRPVPDAIMAYRYRASLKGHARQMYRRGLAEPQLFRDFRAQGAKRPSAARMAGGWAMLALRLPDLARGRGLRGRWVRSAALRVGRLRGSLDHRSLYL